MSEPVVLRLAPLPRAQVGPFLILGVDKSATREVIEAAWAQRVIWARKGLTQIPLEDINWARETLSSVEGRIRADAVSLNLDTGEGPLKKLVDRFQGKQNRLGGAQPLDSEKWLADYTPTLAAPVPEPEEIRAAIDLPTLSDDLPAIQSILEDAVRTPLDPWDVQLDA